MRIWLGILLVVCCASAAFAISGPPKDGKTIADLVTMEPEALINIAPPPELLTDEAKLAEGQVSNLKAMCQAATSEQEVYIRCLENIFSYKAYLGRFNWLAQKELLKVVKDRSQNYLYRLEAIKAMTCIPSNIISLEAYNALEKIVEDKTETMRCRVAALDTLRSAKNLRPRTIALMKKIIKNEVTTQITELSISSLIGIELYGIQDGYFGADPLLLETAEIMLERIAARVVAYRAGPNAFDPTAVSCEILESKDARFLHCATRALGHPGNKKALPFLYKVAADERFQRPNAVDVRCSATSAIERINDQDSVAVLAKTYLDLGKSGCVDWLTLSAMRKINPTKSAQIFRELEKSEDPVIRREAKEAIRVYNRK